MEYADLGELVEVSCPCSEAKSDLNVNSTTTSLSVSGRSGQIIDVPQLFSTVDGARTSWELEEGRLRVHLHKLQTTLVWPTLSAPAVTTPKGLSKTSTETALAAREDVKRLFEAALHGRIDDIKEVAPRLREEGLGSVKDANGRNALHFAAQGGNEAAVDFLIDTEDVKVDSADDSGSQAVVQVLLEANADIEAPSSAGPPLLWAAGSGNEAALSCLLEAGADPDSRTSDGVGAMLMAAAAGNAGVIAALSAKGANPSLPATGGVTALHAAAEAGDLATVKALLKAGANPDAEDAEGNAKPIQAAASAGHRDLVELLLPVTQPLPGQSWTTDSLMKEGSSGRTVSSSPETQQQIAMMVPETEDPDPEKASSSKRAGDEAFVAGKFAEAARHYSQSIQHDARNPLVWANRSAANFRQDQGAEQALADAQIARTLDPKYMKAWYREGEAAKALEKYEDAAQAYFEAFSLEPNSQALAQNFQSAVDLARQAHAKSQPVEP